jgi:uncharacterized protein YbjT (DUF2867 family)
VRVVVTGAGGQTGRLVVQLLVEQGHDVVGLVRRREQAAGLVHLGASALEADLTQLAPSELEPVLASSDAVVWAAGAGFGGDPVAVDAEACLALQRLADEVGVARWLQVSSMFADRPEHGPPFLQQVLAAKQRSDRALAGSGLGWTIVRPGGLSDGPGTGHVALGTGLPGGMVPRADVAAVVVACLDAPATARRSFDLVAGPDPIRAAVDSLALQ